jgi:MFS family permease
VQAPSVPGKGLRLSLFSPERPSYKWWVTLALLLGILTQGLNFGTVNVALPSMMTSLQAEIDTIHWVITAFMVTRTVVMPMVGWIGAVIGPRNFYLGGLLIYIIGSVLCGLAWSIPSLVVFRVIQALGAGPLFPLSMAMLYEIFPASQRGMAMGIFMAGISIGPALGPSIGGYLVEHLNWRMIFYLNLPMGIVALGAVALILQKPGAHAMSRLIKSASEHDWLPGTHPAGVDQGRRELGFALYQTLFAIAAFPGPSSWWPSCGEATPGRPAPVQDCALQRGVRHLLDRHHGGVRLQLSHRPVLAAGHHAEPLPGWPDVAARGVDLGLHQLDLRTAGR